MQNYENTNVRAPERGNGTDIAGKPSEKTAGAPPREVYRVKPVQNGRQVSRADQQRPTSVGNVSPTGARNAAVPGGKPGAPASSANNAPKIKTGIKSDAFAKTGVDKIYLILVLILLAFGTVMVFSASYAYAESKYGDSFYLIKKQLFFCALGIVVMFIISRLNISHLGIYSWMLYILAVCLLLAVPIFGVSEGTAQRWLKIPLIGQFQPSEIAKPAVIMVIAWFLAKHKDQLSDRENYWKIGFLKFTPSFVYGIMYPFVFLGIVCGLVALEHHFSGLLIILALGVIVMLVGGSPARWIFSLGGVGVAVIAAGIMLTGYSSNRITTWLNPESDPTGLGYQTLQGLNAIGSGGLFGLGLGNSNMKYFFVPQPQNDFIFTIVCEELGFIGAAAVMALFAALIWRGFVIASRAPDTFTALVAFGLTSKVAIQVLLNIAVVTNTIPNTGISLPFFSYGGTSLCILMAEMGVMLLISRYSAQKKI